MIIENIYRFMQKSRKMDFEVYSKQPISEMQHRQKFPSNKFLNSRHIL